MQKILKVVIFDGDVLNSIEPSGVLSAKDQSRLQGLPEMEAVRYLNRLGWRVLGDPRDEEKRTTYRFTKG